MSIYTTPALNAVNFALTPHTVPALAGPQNVLSPYTVPALNAVNFALTGFTVPSWVYVGWELLSSFPAQFSGLRYFLGTVRELCLVALGDAPAGDQLRIRKGATDYAVYLVDTTDPNASQLRVQTSAGVKSLRLKT
jgi:hypothetical protein